MRNLFLHFRSIFALSVFISLVVRCTPVPKAEAAADSTDSDVSSYSLMNRDAFLNHDSVFENNYGNREILPPNQPGLPGATISRASPSNQSGFGNFPGQAAGSLQPFQPITGNPAVHLGWAEGIRREPAVPTSEED